MKQGQILAALGLVLVAAGVYAWLAYPRQVEGMPQRASTAQVRTGVDRRPAPQGLALAPLPSREQTAFQLPTKNPFGSLFPPAPAVVKKVRPVVVVHRPPPAPEPLPEDVVEEVVMEPVLAPLPAFKVLGRLTRGGAITVFLEGENGELYLVKEGQSVGMGMQLARVSEEQVELVETVSGRRMPLAMTRAETQRLPGVDFKSGRMAYQQDQEIIPETDDQRERTQ